MLVIIEREAAPSAAAVMHGHCSILTHGPSPSIGHAGMAASCLRRRPSK